MSKKFLRFRDLKSRGIVSNWQTLRRWIREQGFPEGVKLGPNTRAWPEDEINEWLDSRAEAITGFEGKPPRPATTASTATTPPKGGE